MYMSCLVLCLAGDLARASELTTTMREKFGRLGQVSFNTILKVITVSGGFSLPTRCSVRYWGGITPNDISYNSCTVSITLKLCKCHGSSYDYEARKVVAMADQFGIDVFSEEVLLSTLLEVCSHVHERWRLQELLATIWSWSAP
jgi:hypothetical protein